MRVAVAGLLLAAVGCSSGGPEFVPVSGVVTLDGKPYPNAAVTFQPIGSASNPTPGRGSSGLTGQDGRFVLTCDNNIKGAVLGKHQVRITTSGTDGKAAPSPVGGTPDGVASYRTADPIPPEWNMLSKVEFDVPPGGTDKANFDITSKKRR